MCHHGVHIGNISRPHFSVCRSYKRPPEEAAARFACTLSHKLVICILYVDGILILNVFLIAFSYVYYFPYRCPERNPSLCQQTGKIFYQKFCTISIWSWSSSTSLNLFFNFIFKTIYYCLSEKKSANSAVGWEIISFFFICCFSFNFLDSLSGFLPHFQDMWLGLFVSPRYPFLWIPCTGSLSKVLHALWFLR